MKQLSILLFILLIGFSSGAIAQCTGTISSPQAGYCAGDTAIYTVSYQTGNSSYYWYLGSGASGTIIAGQGTATITVAWTHFSGNLIYNTEINCNVTDNVNCFGNVQVNPYYNDVTGIFPAATPGGPNVGIAGTTTTYVNTKSYGAAWGGWHTVTGGTIVSSVHSVTWPVDTITTTVLWTATSGQAEICWSQAYAYPWYCPGTSCFTVTLTNPQPPVATLSGPDSLCSDSIAIYSVPAGVGNSYAWTVTNGTIQSGQGTDQVAVLWPSGGTGTVDVTVSNISGTASGQLNVTVLQAPVTTVTSTAPKVYIGYAPAECTDLTVSVPGNPGNYAYVWSNNAGYSQTITVCPTTTTTYYVTVEARNFCTTVDSITVEALDIRCNGNKVEICYNNSNQTTTTRCVKPAQVPGYLNNGHMLGACGACKQKTPLAQPLDAMQVSTFPNPFSETCEIQVLPANGEQLKIDILDLQGKEVARLFDQEIEAGHPLQLSWSAPKPGIYFCRIMGSNSGLHVQKLLAR